MPVRAGHERLKDTSVPRTPCPRKQLRGGNISPPDLDPLHQEVMNSARGAGRAGRSLVRHDTGGPSSTGVFRFLPLRGNNLPPPSSRPRPSRGGNRLRVPGRTKDESAGGIGGIVAWRRGRARVSRSARQGGGKRRPRWLPRGEPCARAAPASLAGGGLLRDFAWTSVVIAMSSCAGYRRAALRAGMRPSPFRGPAPRGCRRNGGPCGMRPFRRNAGWPPSTPFRRRP